MQVLPQFHHAILLIATINQSNETLLPPIPDLSIDEQTRSLLATIFIAISLSIIILLTILGNILVLIALCIDFALRSPTHLLMGNLACADLLLGITVLPFSGTLEILHGKWLFGRTFCHIWLAIDVLYCTASIYGLMFISIERYVGVTRPLRYPIIITHRRTFYAIIFAWIVAAFVSIAPFLGWRKQVKSTDRTCEVNDDLSYVLFSCSFSFYIPLIIILCVYIRIYGEANRQYQFLRGGEKIVHLKQLVGQEAITLRVHLPKNLSSTPIINGHTSQSTVNANKNTPQIASTGSNKFTRLKRERKAAKTLGIVVGMFILCWLPFFLLLPIKALTSTEPGVFFSICFWLGYCNSCFNPFIYAFSSREFRKAFQSILKCQRMRQYKPSATFVRISGGNNHFRARRSISCDFHSSTSKGRLDSTAHRRISNDAPQHSLSSETNQYIDNSRYLTARNESTTNSTIPRSLSAPIDTSPWHLRKPIHVR